MSFFSKVMSLFYKIISLKNWLNCLNSIDWQFNRLTIQSIKKPKSIDWFFAKKIFHQFILKKIKSLLKTSLKILKLILRVKIYANSLLKDRTNIKCFRPNERMPCPSAKPHLCIRQQSKTASKWLHFLMTASESCICGWPHCMTVS